MRPRLEGKVKDLYAVITDTSTAGAFHDEAKDQADAADRWRIITIGFGVAAALIAVAAMTLSALTEISVAVVTAKVAATLACVAIAAYAGKQSSHHRQREDDAKRLELELVAFEGFVHSLEPAEQRDARKQFIERAFRGRGPIQVARVTDDTAASFGLTPEVLSALRTLLRAIQGQDR